LVQGPSKPTDLDHTPNQYERLKNMWTYCSICIKSILFSWWQRCFHMEVWNLWSFQVIVRAACILLDVPPVFWHCFVSD